jgi:hypothetical protein
MTVYKHTSPDGKVYVGITKADPAHRFNNGNGYKQNALFYADIQKYGWDAFKHEILATGLTVEEACHLEIELIREYDSTNPEKGYNMQDGGMYMCAERRVRKRLRLGEQKDRDANMKEFFLLLSNIYIESSSDLNHYSNLLLDLCEQCELDIDRSDYDKSEIIERYRDTLGALRFIRFAMDSSAIELKEKAEGIKKRGDTDAES